MFPAPDSMHCSVDLLTPLLPASFSSVIFLPILISQRRIFIPQLFLSTLFSYYFHFKKKVLRIFYYPSTYRIDNIPETTYQLPA